MGWYRGSWTGKGIGLVLMLFLLAPMVHAQKKEGMDMKGLSPAVMSIFRQQVSPAALKKKADKGDANAALMLGYMYRMGHKVKKDPVRAVKWFKTSADKGNAEAQLQIAIMSASGEGVKQDLGEMHRWLQKSAENGYGLAQLQLGLLYAKGITVEQDIAVARMWLGFAAEQPGEIGPMAKEVLANLHEEAPAEKGDVMAMPAWLAVAEKYGKALAVLQAGADKGDAHSQYLLGLVFNWLGATDGAQPMNVFYQEAVRYLGMAAGKDYAPAQYQLGRLYFEGHGVSANDEEAVSWLDKSAELGYAPAQVALAGWYDGGHAQRDPELAKTWYERALSKNNWYARAYFIEEELVSSAPDNRDRPIKQWDVRDQYVMALAYEKGVGVPVDPEQAVAWYHLAASQLLPAAQRRLGLAYLEGKGVSVNEAEAAAWLGLAAEQGDAEAMAVLAGLYAGGRGVAQDEKRAFALYEKAASQGVYAAQEGLGLMYRDGRAVKKDRKKALVWLEKGAVGSGSAVEAMLATMQAEVK